MEEGRRREIPASEESGSTSGGGDGRVEGQAEPEEGPPALPGRGGLTHAQGPHVA